MVSDHSMARHVHAAVFATKPRLTSASDADLILPSLLRRDERGCRAESSMGGHTLSEALVRLLLCGLPYRLLLCGLP